MRAAVFLSLFALAVACRGGTSSDHAAGSSTSKATASASSVASSPPSASTSASSDAGVTTKQLLSDEEVGPLIARLSEDPGAFPSDNYVTNETSYLDVEDALRAPELHGRAYVGVGPEQNLTYLSWLEPAVAYIVDIRRGNLLEQMALRGCFEVGRTRLEFLRALLARAPHALSDDDARTASFATLAAAFSNVPGDAALRDDAIARTEALLRRLHVTPALDDDADVRHIHDAFFTKGLALAYSMKNSGRVYPTLAATLSEKDAHGFEASFLATEDAYARVRTRILENRVIPVVGDFGGKHALVAVAADMRARGLVLGVFYTSNVEQYLFESSTYRVFVDSVAAMPHDDASRIVRVWFDQGEAHPAQRPGARTTQLVFDVNGFLAHAAKKPFSSYWEVVTAKD